MKITLVAGARPNFMKIAPIIRAIDHYNNFADKKIHFRLVHTGQHYDDRLSKVFFKELQLPEPDVNLGVGSGSQAEQTGRIMVAFEKELLENPVDLVIVVGDVNSTMACTIAAKKLNTKVAHVEGGIRSFDMTMPEEVNRMVTDSVADYFFTTSHVANENLRRAGVKDDRIFFVGNTMIDSLMFSLDKLQPPSVWHELELKEKEYLILTLHRPANVDDADHLRNLLSGLTSASKDKTIIFPVHPRTKKQFDLVAEDFKTIRGIEPLSYFHFIYLVKHSRGVITDSGGVQEETTVLQVPCITLRSSTERPETITEGTNELIGSDLQRLQSAIQQIIAGSWKKGKIPELWDGQTAARIVSILPDLR